MSALSREQVIDYLSNLPVIEIAELVKELEQKWGVSATAPAPMGGFTLELLGKPADPVKVEEQTEFTVRLKGFGEKKIDVIKAARALNSGLGLKEAKALVESAPVVFKEGVSKAEAEELARVLREAGAEVEIL